MDFISTNHPIENEYPKLVRDNIPDIIKLRTGEEPATRVLSDDGEYLEFLLKKAVEEATELCHSPEHGNLEEELADVFELLDAIMALRGLSREDIVKIQNEKRSKNGGFAKRILMLSKK